MLCLWRLVWNHLWTGRKHSYFIIRWAIADLGSVLLLWKLQRAQVSYYNVKLLISHELNVAQNFILNHKFSAERKGCSFRMEITKTDTFFYIISKHYKAEFIQQGGKAHSCLLTCLCVLFENNVWFQYQRKKQLIFFFTIWFLLMCLYEYSNIQIIM